MTEFPPGVVTRVCTKCKETKPVATSFGLRAREKVCKQCLGRHAREKRVANWRMRDTRFQWKHNKKFYVLGGVPKCIRDLENGVYE